MSRFTGISRIFVLVAGLAVAISGCDKAEDVGRKVMHKSGDLVGKGATEFFSGVGEGVDAVKWKGPDVLTAISTRKSIRKFDASKPVEDDKVEKMLRAAMCAPTAMDKRPWEFVVVKDPAKLSALATRLPYSRVGNGAKLAIVVCGSLDNGLPGRGKEYWIHDCSAATMNLLLAAHAQGGRACFLEKTALPPSARFYPYQMATCRLTSFPSATRQRIRQPRTSGIRRRFITTSGDAAYACALTIFDLVWND